MKLFLICGPWGSGTTSIAGVFSILGIDGCAPFLSTNDPRTPNCYESIEFRKLVLSIASEDSLELTAPREVIIEKLKEFKSAIEDKVGPLVSPDYKLFLKFPLSALIISHICEVFDTTLIYIIRPMEHIESTRRRRGWSVEYGKKGAQLIYGRMFTFFINNNYATKIIRYSEFLTMSKSYIEEIINLTKIEPTVRQREDALNFLFQK